MQLRTSIRAAGALALLALSHSLFAAPADASARPSFYVSVTGAGRPMILIPGLASAGDTYAGMVAHYASQYQCHVLTLAGFVGEPRIEAPFLETVRDELARYIRDKHLDKPVIVGHSLGGFLALWLTETYPDLTGPVIIVDALPFLPAVFQPGATVDSVRGQAEQMRKAMIASNEEQRRKSTESAVRAMVTSDANYQMVLGWSMRSDPVAVGNAMYDLFVHDLRPDESRVTSPVLVIGTWIGLKQYTTRDAVEKNFHAQYSGVKNLQFVMADNARHFVMLDDPEWFLAQTDKFLDSRQ